MDSPLLKQTHLSWLNFLNVELGSLVKSNQWIQKFTQKRLKNIEFNFRVWGQFQQCVYQLLLRAQIQKAQKARLT